jgi:hypothetical protein
MRVVFLTITILLSFAQVSWGKNTRPLINWMPVFVRAAGETWGHGRLPACGQPRFEWDADATLQDGDHASGEEVVGDADPSTCTVAFARGYWQQATTVEHCIITAHELGHLYGRPHSPNPRSIMSPDSLDRLWAFWWTQAGPCRRAMARLPQWSPAGRLWYALRPGV